MKFYIDSANLQQIKEVAAFFPIAGVTTNPSIVVKEKQPFISLLQEIRAVVGKEKKLFAQVIGSTEEEIIADALLLREKADHELIVKIPVTQEGIGAIKRLALQGIPTLATAVYTPMQAIVAAQAGASYVAPYVNRIDQLAGNGVQVAAEITAMLKQHELPCEVVAASFKNVQQIQQICLAGAHNITAAPEVLKALVNHPSTQQDVEAFQEEWTNFYHQNKLSE